MHLFSNRKIIKTFEKLFVKSEFPKLIIKITGYKKVAIGHKCTKILINEYEFAKRKKGKKKNLTYTIWL